ncbi:transporter, putative [Ricinus communis]|uniref:Transporter, putative n=2 Tax=Ricinus communis TaxID=3988 RepID=B9S1M9_RICCO|nr:transporter, putative [Ricinus communis]
MSYHNALLISSIPKLVLTNCNDNKKYPNPKSNNPPPAFLGVAAASASLFFTLTIGVSRSSLAAPVSTPIAKIAPIQEDDCNDVDDDDAFENWKSKTFALSVPLRIVALRGSIPPSWIKDFMQSQGKRLRLRSKLVGGLDNIFSDLSMSFSNNNIKRKVNIGSSSVAAADIVSIGDSWLSFAIQKALIEPIRGVEDQDWFKGLSDKWKVYLRRNCEGSIDPNGEIWGAPYRWGSMVIAYKKSKFQKNKLAPIEDWADLWRPDLKGRISMIDSPREVVGAVLKYMGASYNAKDIELEVHGGKSAVQENLALFGKQVRLFDSMHYLKAFGVGDVWVAVGWSSDVLPVAKRMSNIAVVVPKSGSSLWADLWAIPAASRLATNRIGGRVRGPSPLIHQWIEFCLQAARAMPFKQEVIPGASPSALESTPVEVPEELTRGKPRLDTNLIAGVPPPEILSRCEFLEPLSDAQLLDYKWLIASMQQPGPNLIHRIHPYISSLVRSVGRKSDSKVI